MIAQQLLEVGAFWVCLNGGWRCTGTAKWIKQTFNFYTLKIYYLSYNKYIKKSTKLDENGLNQCFFRKWCHYFEIILIFV